MWRILYREQFLVCSNTRGAERKRAEASRGEREASCEAALLAACGVAARLSACLFPFLSRTSSSKGETAGRLKGVFLKAKLSQSSPAFDKLKIREITGGNSVLQIAVLPFARNYWAHYNLHFTEPYVCVYTGSNVTSAYYKICLCILCHYWRNSAGHWNNRTVSKMIIYYTMKSVQRANNEN